MLHRLSTGKQRGSCVDYATLPGRSSASRSAPSFVSQGKRMDETVEWLRAKFEKKTAMLLCQTNTSRIEFYIDKNPKN